MKKTRSKTAFVLMMLVGGMAVPVQAGPPPEAKCEAGKNKAAGKYATCLQAAASKLISSKGACSVTTTTTCYIDSECPALETCAKDQTKYNEAVAKCEAKLADSFDKLEEKAIDEGAACPTTDDDPGIGDTVDDCTATVQDSLVEGGSSPTCGDNAINVVGEQCDGTELGGESCASLSFSGGTLACASCAFDTSGCTGGGACTGNATVGDVLAGKTFSNGSMTGITGTMVNNGSVVITPSTSSQMIAAGYHNGAGYCEGDADLTATNIRAGQSIFGVVGDANVVDTGSGNTTAAEVVSGKVCWVDGSEVTGTMTNVGQQVITPAVSNQAITAGRHDGTGYCAGDADLVAANIADGVELFGVTGTLPGGGGLPKTGQVTSYGAGSDGAVQAGSARSFTTDTVLGTITDELTGLMWEMKTQSTGVHSWSNTYSWTGASFGSTYSMDGTLTVFLDIMNNRCDGNESMPCTGNSECTGVGNGLCGHAGYRDWRVPNFLELVTIWDMEKNTSTGPATFAAFHNGCAASCTFATCSCTSPSPYWSSTTIRAGTGSTIHLVNMLNGTPTQGTKNSQFAARAVRVAGD